MSSDFIAKVRVSHHKYAAWTWAIAAVIWLVALARYLACGDEPEKPKSACPRRSC
jgi:hypothetical protein